MNDLISKTALLKHLDMAIECEDCPRNINKDLYTCNMRTTFEGCTCSEVSQICCRITNFVSDVQAVAETENMATVSDEFICKKCDIYLKDYVKVVLDVDNEGYVDEQHYDYEPKYCPECGAKVK